MRRLLGSALLAVTVLGGVALADDQPAWSITQHDVGRMTLSVTNRGALAGYGAPDCITGDWIVYGLEYPKGSGLGYVDRGILWVGAVVGEDTLVSWSWSEMAPDVAPFGNFRAGSILDPDSAVAANSISEQDRICTYYDTLVREFSWDYTDYRYHQPLGIEVTQRSYAWSYSYAEDFVIVDLEIRNISENTWKDMYFGIDWNPGAGVIAQLQRMMVGFERTFPSPIGCGYMDTLNLAWGANNDGDPVDGEWVEPIRPSPSSISGIEGSVRSVVALRILEPPSEHMSPAFNWLYSLSISDIDWGPQHQAHARDMGGDLLGYYPAGDANRYFVMSNHEFDYDQAYTAVIPPYDSIWQYPTREIAEDVAVGQLTYFLLTYGPFTNFQPGSKASIAFAVVAGEHFHNDPYNIDNLPDNPDQYMANLDFSDLAKNALWAEWIYDNPGWDTDGDGYAGEYRVCVYDSTATDSGWIATVAETTWYRGDGVPDWRGAAPPPAPYFWVEAIDHGIRIRFNGERSETKKDIFTHEVDFEGYRIYMGRDDRWDAMSLVCSYDRENFNKWVWDYQKVPRASWVVQGNPFTLRELRCIYGSGEDPCNDISFYPLDYGQVNWMTIPGHADSMIFFERHDYNASIYGVTTDIRKVYPDEPDPRGLPVDSLRPDMYTDEGHLKFFEYEYIIKDVLPSVAYCVNVTAFDYGSAASGVNALETSRVLGAVTIYPAGSGAIAAGSDDRVYVYPNPYRIDSEYRDYGYEGRSSNRVEFRTRALHFANLPPRCRIGIYSLDGDMIRQIEHNQPESDPLNNHDTWNLITRNHQLVVSGLYYWTVESPGRPTQIGKFAVIK